MRYRPDSSSDPLQFTGTRLVQIPISFWDSSPFRHSSCRVCPSRAVINRSVMIERSIFRAC